MPSCRKNTTIETLEAKSAFQKHSMEKGVIIRDYYATNIIYKSNKRQQPCRDERQKLSFTGREYTLHKWSSREEDKEPSGPNKKITYLLFH